MPNARVTLRSIWRQLPFFLWLILIWMLMWGQFTLLSVLTGMIIAFFVVRVFALPPVEASGRINLWFLLVVIVTFLRDVITGSLQVAWQAINPLQQPKSAIIAVQLITDDDLIMTHVSIVASLIPGSLILEADREQRVLYLHVIGVRSDRDVHKQRIMIQRWERRIVRAVGSKEQLAAVRKGAV